MSDNSSKSAYNASNIEILPRYMAIRKRPRMYISETSISGLSKTIADTTFDSLDPAKMNVATEAWITALTDSSYIFQDNGRGIPIKRPGRFSTESIFEVLVDGPGSPETLWESYQSYGFLLGSGTVLNALAEKFAVETTFNGTHSHIEFSRGQVVTPLTESVESNKQGTKIIFKPDKEIWEDVAVEPQILLASIKEAFKEFTNAHITLEEPSSATERFRIKVTVN